MKKNLFVALLIIVLVGVVAMKQSISLKGLQTVALKDSTGLSNLKFYYDSAGNVTKIENSGAPRNMIELAALFAKSAAAAAPTMLESIKYFQITTASLTGDGVGIIITVPANERWELISLSVLRTIGVPLGDGTLTYIYLDPITQDVVTASTAPLNCQPIIEGNFCIAPATFDQVVFAYPVPMSSGCRLNYVYNFAANADVWLFSGIVRVTKT